MNQRPFRANERILHLLLVSAKLLREGDGHGVLQICAADFHHASPRYNLGVQRLL